MQIESVLQTFTVILLAYSSTLLKLTWDRIKKVEENHQILDQRLFDHISDKVIHKKS